MSRSMGCRTKEMINRLQLLSLCIFTYVAGNSLECLWTHILADVFTTWLPGLALMPSYLNGSLPWILSKEITRQTGLQGCRSKNTTWNEVPPKPAPLRSITKLKIQVMRPHRNIAFTLKITLLVLHTHTERGGGISVFTYPSMCTCLVPELKPVKNHMRITKSSDLFAFI